MPYPTLTKAEARAYLQALDIGPEPPRIPEARPSDGGPDEDWDTLGADAAARLMALLPAGNEVKGSLFEAAAAPELHSLLPEHPALADPEFWVWLAITHCREVVDRRYPGKRNLKNFGIGGAGENLLYRLWLRADIARSHGARDEYELARFGDVDFWRSHIFRQRYGEVRPFARALIGFQFPSNNDRRPRLKIDEIRALAKRLKRARTNLMFEVMDEVRAARFIESEWERLASEAADRPGGSKRWSTISVDETRRYRGASA